MIWMRAVGPLPDDPLLHVCAAADANDMTLLNSVLVAACAEGSATDGAVTGANLDQAM